MTDEPTLGEVGRAVSRVEAELGHLPERYVSREAFLEWKRTTDAQIKELQDWKTWALRIVIGAVMLAMLGLVLANAAGASTKSLAPIQGVNLMEPADEPTRL